MDKDNMEQQDFLILYLESDLDRAYRIDCRMRTKQDLAWIKREDFRKVYDELLEAHLIGMPEMPLEVVIQCVYKILESDIRLTPDELEEREKENEI